MDHPGLIIDGHLDLAWNALAYDRDQTCAVDQLRQREREMAGSDRGGASVSLTEMRKGGVAVCFVSLLARARPEAVFGRCPDRTDIDYANQSAAYAVAQGQLAYYQLLETQGHLRIIHDVDSLDVLWRCWQEKEGGHHPIGVVLSMEGADPIAEPGQTRAWWDQRVRALSLAHYGPSAYAYGTPDLANAHRGVTTRGRLLLEQTGNLGVMLDLTHASDASFFEAADLHSGPIFASHSNCRALVPGTRQLSDEQIKLIADRGGVIGCVLEVSMLDQDWKEDSSEHVQVGLEAVANHIDHICQLTGSVHHAAIGSDLDGGFGAPRRPYGLDTIADLAKLGPILSSRGYRDEEIKQIFHGNWLQFLRAAWSSQ